MNRTKIEWVKNPDGSQGYSWNPITGCLNGCPYCHAQRLANGRLRAKYLANNILASHNEPNHKEHCADLFGNPLDPSIKEGNTSSKVGIDATKSLDYPQRFERVAVPAEAATKATKTLRKYLPL